MPAPICKKEQPGKCFHGSRGALVRAFDLNQLVVLNQPVGHAHLVAAIKLAHCWVVRVDVERELTRNLSSLSTNFLGGSTCNKVLHLHLLLHFLAIMSCIIFAKLQEMHSNPGLTSIPLHFVN